MTAYAGRDDAGDISAIKSDGTEVAFAQSGPGCTLANSTTYYFPVGSGTGQTGRDTPLLSVHLKWAAAVVATFTVECSNMPRRIGGIGGVVVDVSDYDSTAGNWIQENPSTAIVAVSGSGNSSTAATVTAGGSAAGGCVFHLGNLGTKRIRIKAVVTTGGVVRCNVHGKV